MLQARHLLAEKDARIVSIGPDEPVLAAIRMMADHYIGALLVMEHGRLAGIVSERDYARKVILKGRSSAQTPVRDIMSSPVITVGPDETIDACMRICTNQRVRHLPVVEGDHVVGVLSIGDLVKAVISAQSQEIEQLQRYIAG